MLNKKGQTLLTTLMGIAILGATGMVLFSNYNNLASIKDKNNDLNEASWLLDNFRTEVRQSNYKDLPIDYSNKTFTKYMDSSYTIKTKVEQKGPCNSKGLCNYTLITTELYDANGILVDTDIINRAYIPFFEKSTTEYPADSEVNVKLPANIISMKFKAWGAGGGAGGNDGAGCGSGREGGHGHGGGYVYTKTPIDLSSTDKLDIVIGSAGHGGYAGHAQGASAGKYGGGGAGGSSYSSGSGGSGGGASMIKLNDTIIAVAGGGGGGGGGVDEIRGGNAPNSYVQTTSVSGMHGQNVGGGVDGGGGGGGGGSYPFGGAGGHNGADRSYATAGGQSGKSFVINSDSMEAINGNGVNPGNADDPERRNAGTAGYAHWGCWHNGYNGNNGKIILQFSTIENSTL